MNIILTLFLLTSTLAINLSHEPHVPEHQNIPKEQIAAHKEQSINDITQAFDSNIFAQVDANSTQKTYERKKYVHIIPHSHTDLGWLSTLDDYFEGKNLGFYFGSIS
jgi:hypothetical protein